ncbi:speckle-type POZ protein-like [Uloborus diversus]|uniref:speckle-type POZ protein-like n=1 Tax=Uloborus diversus TaxID=327109 RepID=UPI00240A7363|nr:speckle-type POZ protein-like [Uloborus diversus]
MSKSLIIHFPTPEKSCSELIHKESSFDVIIKIGNQEILAHKLALRTSSAVFDAMFEHNMKENLHSSIEITDMSASTMRCMLFYMYHGYVPPMSFNAAYCLYHAADKYLLLELKQFCVNVMNHTLTLETLRDVALTSEFFQDDSLKYSILRLFSELGHENVISSPQWQALEAEKPDLANDIKDTFAISQDRYTRYNCRSDYDVVADETETNSAIP